MTRFGDEYRVDTVDMIDGTWREKDFSGYDAVFHVAGIAHTKETKANADLYYKVNRDLAAKTAQKAKVDGARQFVFLSSMSVYGMETGVITRETVPNPKNNYGKSKYQAEIELQKLAGEDFIVSIVRPPMVYGKGCKGNFQTLSKWAKKLPIFPVIKNQRSIIYVDNLSFFVKQIIDGAESSEMYMPQNDEYVCTGDMVKKIAVLDSHKITMILFLIGL